MPNAIAYGKALYYPYIHFQDEHWLKTAALYYDGLFRMVPDYYQPQDSDIVKRIIGELGFVENLPTRQAASTISNHFLEYFEREFGKKNQREALYSKLTRAGRSNELQSLHIDKLSYMLWHKLWEMDLAKKSRRNRDGFIKMDGATAAIYMTYLANHLSGQKNAPVVTDNAVFHPLLRGMASETTRRDMGSMLASLVIRTAVPEPVENLPISKIKKFREKHADERLLFYEEVNNLVKDLKGVTDQGTLEHTIRNKERKMNIATNNLARSYKSVGITAGTGLLSLSVPAVVSGAGVAAGAGAAGMLFIAKAVGAAIDYKRTKMESPYAYVLALRKLRSKSFIEQVLKGEILL